MERILIIGGTGNVGRHVVTQLSGSGTQVRALARNPARLNYGQKWRSCAEISRFLSLWIDASTGSIQYSWCESPRQPLPDQLWRRLRGTPGGSYTFQLRSKHRIRSSNSLIHLERWPNGSND